MDIKKIKDVQRLTNAGIVACKAALERYNGDLFEAVASLISYEDAKLMRSELLNRQLASGELFQEEEDFVERLIRKLEPDQDLIEMDAPWRPGVTYQDGLWMCFCDAFAYAALVDPNFRNDIKTNTSVEVNRFWDIFCRDMRQKNPFNLVVEVIAHGGTDYLYIELPTIRSWSNALAIVCEQIDSSVKPRVYQIYSQNADCEVKGLEVNELDIQRDEVVVRNCQTVALGGSYSPRVALARMNDLMDNP